MHRKLSDCVVGGPSAMNEIVDNEHSSIAPIIDQRVALEIPNAPPVRLQTSDLVRHVAIAPDGKRYVVATFHDKYVDKSFVTAIYPQQNGYLTLYRLVIHQVKSETAEDALQRHVAFIQTIQQGKLDEDFLSTQKEKQ
jgi:hypothetical protein